MLRIILSLCVFLVLLESGQSQNLVNNSCVLQNGKNGKCQRFKECPSAVDMVRKRKGTPVNCGFEGKNPIVCCETQTQLLRQRKVGDISKQKCKEMYSSLSARTIRRNKRGSTPKLKNNLSFDELIAIVKKEEEQAKRAGLPTNTVRKFAVGGKDAVPKEFPHMAALGYGEKNDISWGCGGSLISEKFVLTAAHCIRTRIGMVKYVRLGDLNLKTTTDIAKPQNYDVRKRIVHPKYKAPSVYHDIAIVELSSHVVIDDFVRPGCLYTGASIPSGQLSATGWGLIGFQGVQANHLQEVILYESAFKTCRDAYKSESKRRLPTGIDKDMHICAGDQGKDTCEGDSGGPLQIKNTQYPRGYSIIGVTSFGKACGIGTSIAVYTRVSSYIDWIESIVWPQPK